MNRDEIVEKVVRRVKRVHKAGQPISMNTIGVSQGDDGRWEPFWGGDSMCAMGAVLLGRRTRKDVDDTAHAFALVFGKSEAWGDGFCGGSSDHAMDDPAESVLTYSVKFSGTYRQADFEAGWRAARVVNKRVHAEGLTVREQGGGG